MIVTKEMLYDDGKENGGELEALSTVAQ